VYHLIQRRDIQDCSFAFEIDGDGDSWSECEDPDNPGERIALRTVSRAKLYDCSVVQAPAYEGTDVDTEDDNEDDDLFPNAMPRAMRDYFPAQFPTSMPVELRSRIITANVKQSSRAREARQRLLNICLS
jgi:phage head maturation protease